MTIETLIETLKNLCDRAQGCWEDAQENSPQESRRLEIEGEEAECIDHWVDAIQSIQQHGFRGCSAAIESLKMASAIARNYGDNHHEEKAIAVVTVFSGKAA